MTRSVLPSATRKIKEGVRALGAFFLDMLFPIECRGCGRIGAWLCPDCRKKLSPNPKSFCLHCRQASSLGYFCVLAKKEFRLEGVIIAGDYKNGILKNLIKTFKYGAIKSIGQTLYAFLSDYLSTDPLIAGHLENLSKNQVLLIPVPLHKKRLAWRGFNQAAILAALLADDFGFALDSKNLKKRKNTRPQAGLRGQKRKKNLQQSFFWTGENLKNQPILIIDDVTTTGATLNECAAALKQAGAGEIWGLAIAKG